MKRLRRYQFQDAISELPSPVKLEASAMVIDIYIAALGFESRSSAVPEFLGNNGYKIKQALILEYSTNIEANERMRPSIQGNVMRCGAEISWCQSGLSDFIARIRASIAGFVDREGEPPNVAVDISSMTSRLVMSLTAAVLSSDADLRILYAEAAIYFPTRDDFENNKDVWRSPDSLGLERGVGEVAIAVDFPGAAESDRPDWVLAFAGFGRDRMRRAISYVNPALLIESDGSVGWAVGRPPAEDNAWRTNALRYIHEISDSADVIDVSTFDYRDTMLALEKACRERERSHNITLIPLGSKLQGLGMGLYCAVRRNVRVVSATPSAYRTDQYSAGIAAIWQIEFGDTLALRSLLEMVDTLRWEVDK